MDGWIWSNGGMVLTGETEILGEKPYTVWVVDRWMSMEQWWNDTDRGNWNTGRKTLYSVGGRWMNECGAMVEWYWLGKTKLLGEKHYTVWVVNGWMSMEQWLNDTDRGKLKYWERNIIERGLQMDEWVLSNGGMILTENPWYWEKSILQFGW